jgi:UDP-N-acetylmuramyl pentapeptide phosphotransferase/UDP-N-acetylglucosamine-1-phosphate transferase
MREILIAGAFSMLVSLFGTPILIRGLARRGYGQIIRDDGPSSHHTKRGTPTMGGIIIILASFTGFLASHALTRVALSISAVLVMGLVLSLGFVGFLDDWLKVSRQRSLGLTGRQKIFGQTLFAAIFGILGIHFPDRHGLTPLSLHLSTVRDTSIKLGVVLNFIWIIHMVISTGFLWWNASPAKIFMGDTGSLALGGALAGLAATLRTQLLLIPLGGLFVVIASSVIIQRVYFKISGGKRVFRMAPLQHHFELLGWGEVTIVLRFWIIAGLSVALGLGLFYAQWVAR